MTIGITFFGGAAAAPAPATTLDSYLTNLYLAYHQKRLRSAYAGSALNVRRSSDSTSQAIGFDADGHLDSTALASFVGAGDGHVVTWYDQSATANNLTQATAGQQPRIVIGGSYLGEVRFDDSDDTMATVANVGALTAATFFCPGNLFASSAGQLDISFIVGGSAYLYVAAGATDSPQNITVSNDSGIIKFAATSAQWDGWAFRFDSAASGIANQLKAYRNGAQVSALSTSGALAATNAGPLRLSGTGGGSLRSGNRQKGFVVYNAALSDADIAAIWPIVNAL